MRVLITVLYLGSVAFLVTGVALVLRDYRRDSSALFGAMSSAASPFVPALPLVAIGLFPMAFDADEQRELAFFLGELQEILASVAAQDDPDQLRPPNAARGDQSPSVGDDTPPDASLARLVDMMPDRDPYELEASVAHFVSTLETSAVGEIAQPWPEATASPGARGAEIANLLKRVTDELGMSAEFAAMGELLRWIHTRPQAEVSSEAVRDYRAVAEAYRDWASRATLRTVTRDLSRRRDADRTGGYIALIGASLDIVATMLWLWAT